MIWYVMIRYDIWYDVYYMILYDTICYLLQLGFHPVTSVGKLLQKYEIALYTKGCTIHKTIKKHRIHKIESKTFKTRKQTKKVLKT